MSVKVLRDGQRLDVQLPLRAMRPEEDRVPPYVFGRGPDYVVVGRSRLRGAHPAVPRRPGATGRAARRRACSWRSTASRTRPATEPQRIVLLSSVLPDAANLGYQELRDLIVERVNGHAIATLADVRQGPDRARAGLPGGGVPAGPGVHPCRPRRRGGRGRRPRACSRPTGSRGSTRPRPEPSVLGRFPGEGVDWAGEAHHEALGTPGAARNGDRLRSPGARARPRGPGAQRRPPRDRRARLRHPLAHHRRRGRGAQGRAPPTTAPRPGSPTCARRSPRTRPRGAASRPPPRWSS